MNDVDVHQNSQFPNITVRKFMVRKESTTSDVRKRNMAIGVFSNIYATGILCNRSVTIDILTGANGDMK